jgi:hypothetical protein
MTELLHPIPESVSERMAWPGQWEDHSTLDGLSSSDASFTSSSSRRKLKPYRSPKHDDTSPGIVFQFPSLMIAKDANELSFGKFRVLSYPSRSDISTDSQDSFMSLTDSSESPRKREYHRKKELLYHEGDEDVYAYLKSSVSTAAIFSSSQATTRLSSMATLRTSKVPTSSSMTTVKLHRREPKNSINPIYQGKRECAACFTKKTPYWRNSWDDLLLCNACGIRYHKYRIYCKKCKYVPRKEERGLKSCPRCFERF